MFKITETKNKTTIVKNGITLITEYRNSKKNMRTMDFFGSVDGKVWCKLTKHQFDENMNEFGGNYYFYKAIVKS